MTRATSRLTSCIALVLVARTASGTPPCRNEIKRSKEDIVFSEPGRRPAILIESGETICLAVGVDRTGQVYSVQLSEDAPSLQVRLEGQKGNSQLLLSSFTDSIMHFRLARLQGPARLALSTRDASVGPFQTRTISLRGRAPAVALLGDVSYAPIRPERAQEDAPRPPGDLADRSIGVSLNLVGGIGHMPLDSLNRSLESYGYSPLAATVPMLGFAFGFTGERFRIEVALLRTTRESESAAGEPIEVRSYDGAALVGYDVLRWRGFSALVAAGPAFTGTTLDASNPGYPVFSQRLGGTSGSKASRETGGWAAELGLEQIVPLVKHKTSIGLALGLRAGYTWQLDSGSWTDDESGRSAGQGPPTAMGGFRARMSIGAIFFE